jgi:polygalacturonase
MRTGATFDVRDHGAKGDGVALDSPAINAAILAAEAAGGGLVILPPGKYLSFSLRLKSRVTLVIEEGATLIAAEKGPLGAYDLPEERGPQLYQDFGHSYWHTSLIWAEHAEDIAIIGKGRILGLGLTRNGPGTPWSKQAGERPLSMAAMPAADIGKLERDRAGALQARQARRLQHLQGRAFRAAGERDRRSRHHEPRHRHQPRRPRLGLRPQRPRRALPGQHPQ